jgi:DNA repair exonuclease SbcCD nuclease subunit
MLRLLHTADVHLGARHADLGDAAIAQRERQFAAFGASVDLALAEKVDLFLIAGDLFDSNVQPGRSVERVAAELGRLAKARIRSVLVPGTHDVYDRSSVYRAYDLAALAGAGPDDGMVTVLTPARPWIHLPSLDAVVHGPVFATKRAPHSPLRDLASVEVPPATWKIGLLHAAIAIPGRTDHDEVVITTDEIAASGLDYLALGHWHAAQVAKAGGVTYAYSGAPEPVAVDQDRAGKVLLVTLDEHDGRKTVKVEERKVGRTTFQRLEIDAATVASQPALQDRLRAMADADVVMDVRLIGVRPDELDLDPGEIERALGKSFLRVRVRDGSQPALTEGALPSPDTISGAFIRNVEGRIAELEASGDDAAAREALELRDVLRLGRLLLAGHEVTL